jgi:thymidylate kinase
MMALSESMLFEPHREAGRLIMVEGDPGAGKTSAIISLVRRGNFSVVPQLDHVIDQFRHVPFNSAHPEDWYVAVELLRQTEVRRLLNSGKQVLQDRSILSTLGFAYASTASSQNQERFERIVRHFSEGEKVIKPDLFVLMNVDIETGLQRRNAFSQDEHYRTWFDRDFLARYQAFYSTVVPCLLNCAKLTLNTSDLSLEEVTEILANLFSRESKT